ncbi:MAG: PEP/pyruvate-binding domain-containing protein [Planctomycetota bacterium]
MGGREEQGLGAWAVPLREAREPARVGEKAARLGALLRAGFTVPEGFVVGAEAWDAFRARALGDASLELPGVDREEALGRLARRCLEAPLPLELSQALAAGLRGLPGPYAVRSSAPGEDGSSASAAGQFRTVLGAADPAQVRAALRRVWASVFSPGADAYRAHLGDAPASMAVIVQRLLPAERAGVAFLQGSRVVIEAVHGRGERLVDGSATPERHELELGESLPTPPRTAVCGASLLAELRELCAALRDTLGGDLDVEWAHAEGRLWVLQARPLTRALPAGATGRVCWTAANTQEALLEPATPLTWSVLEPLVEAGRRDLFRAAGFSEVPGPGYMRLFGGLPYFNPDYFRRFLEQIPGMPQELFDELLFGTASGSVQFRLPEVTPRTLRLAGLYGLCRVAARERFEVFARVFDARLALRARRALHTLDDASLLRERREVTELAEGAFRRHVAGTAVAAAGYLLLDVFLRWSGAEDAFPGRLVGRLTAGASGNAVAESSERLEQIARAAAQRPRLVAALRQGADLPQLDALVPEGRWFVGEVEDFLARYGHRAEKEAELSAPRWADDPTIVLEILTTFVEAARGQGHGLRRLAQRESALELRARELADAVSAWLRDHAPAERLVPWRRATFRALLREARRYAPYRENLKDRALRALHRLRQVFLEGGQRLAARGALERADDVFYLELAEFEAALSGGGDALAPRVRARRAERERQLTQEAPRLVIEVPGQPPRPIYAGAAERLLQGVGVSAGTVTGRVRVLKGLEEAKRVQPGDVVVARVVNAAWSPLFHLAGAVVAEVGGALSHAAIVAREFGVPAVFGVSGATSLQDGVRVTVDGDLGLVTLAPEPAAPSGGAGCSRG